MELKKGEKLGPCLDTVMRNGFCFGLSSDGGRRTCAFLRRKRERRSYDVALVRRHPVSPWIVTGMTWFRVSGAKGLSFSLSFLFPPCVRLEEGE